MTRRRSVTMIYPWLLDPFVERMCECCGRRPYTVYCDDCHIEVFGRIGRAW